MIRFSFFRFAHSLSNEYIKYVSLLLSGHGWPKMFLKSVSSCADTLYSGRFISPGFPNAVFNELKQMATSGVEFSFNNTMYRHTVGIAMSSPLGPVSANIFVGYNENKLFDFSVKPQLYKRYVDNTFAIFENEAECSEFFNILNSLNAALKFTCEKESESLTFLDVKIQKSDNKFITSVYRKASFTGQYIRWDSFGLSKRKKNLISTLVHRALCICSKSMLQQEFDNVRVILGNNGYPESNTDRGISNKLARFQSPPKFGPNKCPVYLKLPWIGNISLKFENKIKSSVKHCFRAVEPRVLFSNRKILSFIL